MPMGILDRTLLVLIVAHASSVPDQDPAKGVAWKGLKEVRFDRLAPQTTCARPLLFFSRGARDSRRWRQSGA